MNISKISCDLKDKIAVLGDGGWGTTLAIHLAKKGYCVNLWGAFPSYLKHLERTRINTKFLPGIKLPKKISLSSDIFKVINGAELIILAIPSQFMRQVVKKLKGLNLSKSIFLSVTKGIENQTLLRMSQVIESELGNIRLAVLSGPTIAHEVAKNIPSTAVIASRNKDIARRLQDIFMTERLRIYTNSDIVGVELGGSLKNIIAIACGISDGLGFGTNTKAALLSRGLAEITRLGIAMSAKKETFSGLSGLGDLVTTCVSPYSRNRSVGEQIGKGNKLAGIIKSMEMIAEGIPTAKAAYGLSKRYNIEMPITNQVYLVLYHGKDPLAAVNDLMLRKKKQEY